LIMNSKTVSWLSPIRKEGNDPDSVHTHPNSFPYFITAIKHGYICFIS